jgi:hypothetical protein
MSTLIVVSLFSFVVVGGTLKIYGDTLCPDVPYKTLLLSVTDNAAYVVRETLNKYGLENENEQNYCLVQVIVVIVSNPFCNMQYGGCKFCEAGSIKI